MKKTMKMFAAMFVAATMFALTGCSKDYSEDDLVGTWNWKKTTMTETISGLTGAYAQYNGSQTETETASADNARTITFNSDHTCTTTEIDEGYTHTSNGTWSLNDDKLTVTYSEGGETRSESVTIDELDGKKMIWTASDSMDEEVVPGMTAHISYTAKMEFEKK